MTIKNITKEGSQATVQVEISKEQLEAAKTAAYNKAKKSIQIPGFRKGHAPRKMIEAMYGADVFLEDAINELFPSVYTGIVDEGLKVVGTPDLTNMDKNDEGLLELTVVVPLYPEVTLGQYKGLEVPKAEAVVTEADVDAEVERMAMNVSRLETVERAAQNGDTVNIDFEGFVDGVAFDGGKSEGYDLKLGEGQFIPGFEDQIVGMSAGEERDINVTFPENYKEDLAGKAAVFHIKANAVKELIKPELDDEFVKDVSEFETMDELRNDIKARTLADKQKSIDAAFESAAIEKAFNNMQADIPECMIDEEIDYQLKQVGYQLQMSGMTMEQYVQMFGGEAQLRNTMRPTALRQVKTHVLLTKVAQEENIEATEEDVKAEYAKIAEAYNMELDAVMQRLPEESLKVDICNRKAGELISSSAVAVAEPEAKADEAVEAPAAEEPAAE